MDELLWRDGLTVALLTKLSYPSRLGISLKKNLHYFDREQLMTEIGQASEWYEMIPELNQLALDFRVKSEQSARMKYDRFYPDHQARKVFDDLLGLRSLCDSYAPVLELGQEPNFRVADMSQGKAGDDGYRGVHLYFQLDNQHYPIEIQYNTYYDRQMNNWLHKYVYKKNIADQVGATLRKKYEQGSIINEQQFQEVLSHVLCTGET